MSQSSPRPAAWALDQNRVVAVGSVDGPADGDALGVGEDLLLPSELGPISRILARSFTSSWAFVQTPVDRHLGEVQADELVVSSDGLRRDGVEDSSALSFIAAGPHGGVGDLVPTEPLGVFEAAPGHQAHQHHLEAVQYGGGGRWQSSGWLSLCTGSRGLMAVQTVSNTSGSSARMMVCTSTCSLWVGKHPDCLGATTTTSGWSGALRQKCLTAPRPASYSPGLLISRRVWTVESNLSGRSISRRGSLNRPTFGRRRTSACCVERGLG